MTKDINNIILLGLAGSRGIGVANEDSDYDYRGIYLPSARDILLGNKDENFSFTEEECDTTIYNFRHCLKLLKNSNFSMLELLAMPEYEIITSLGRKLKDNFNLFVSTPTVSNQFKGTARGFIFRKGGNERKKYFHACRVLFCGIRLFDSGVMMLDHPEFKKYAEKSTEELKVLYEELLEEFVDAEHYSVLPPVINTEAIDDFIVDVYTAIVKIGVK